MPLGTASEQLEPTSYAPHSMVVCKAVPSEVITEIPASLRRPPVEKPQIPAFSGRGARWLDPFHGIPNACFFDHRLNEEFQRARRHERPLSVVLFRVSLDNGLPSATERAVEQAMVTMVAQAIRRACRDFDIVCRREGCIVGVILPETPRSGAFAFYHRIGRIIQRAWLESPPSVGRPTLHHGIGSRSAKQDTPFELLAEAEEALLFDRGVDENHALL